MKHFPALIFALLFLPGCATLNKSECLTANWLTIGYEDGVQGQSRDRIGSHRQACAEYGITPDLKTYQEGFERGALVFCTPRNGFAIGQSGSQYNGICPSEVEGEFLQGYDAGREIFQESSTRNELASELREIHSRLSDIEDHIANKEHELLADAVPKDKRRKIYRMINDLKEEHYHLMRRYNHLQRQKRDVDYTLSALRRKYRTYE